MKSPQGHWSNGKNVVPSHISPNRLDLVHSTGKKGPTEVEPKFMLFELVFYPVQGGMSKSMIMFSETMQCSLLLVLQESGAINALPST